MAEAGLWLRDMICDKTTENGEDEVVCLVAGVLPDGSQYKERFPKNKDHWDMNDGKEPRKITDQPVQLWRGEIPDGGTAEFVVTFPEIDGGNGAGFGQALDALGSALVQKGGAAAVAGAVVELAGYIVQGIDDSDDYLGSVRISLKNEGGTIRADFATHERSTYAGHSDNRTTQMFRLNGDKSNYITYFRAGTPTILQVPGIGDDPDRYDYQPTLSN